MNWSGRCSTPTVGGTLAEKLVGKPGATTPWLEKPGDQTQAEEELLQRLVDLNHQRAAEEQKGKIRWLRPEYQNPAHAITDATATQEQTAFDIPAAPAKTETTMAKTPWPKGIPEQIKALRAILDQYPGPANPATIGPNLQGRANQARCGNIGYPGGHGTGQRRGGRYAGA